MHSHFAPVRINADTTFDWDDSDHFEGHHYAFVVSDSEFEEIFGRLKAEGVAYGSGPSSPRDGEINLLEGGCRRRILVHWLCLLYRH